MITAWGEMLAAHDRGDDKLFWHWLDQATGWQIRINWLDFRNICPHRIGGGKLDKQVNALRVEIFTPADRCIGPHPDKPAHIDTIRWLGSGGHPTVFPVCECRNCPYTKENCCESD
ncbi:MAG: hypothetical protein ACYC6A_24200 [Armatimonadota bacterium]